MLEVHFPSTDIDAICVFPSFVSRQDFFDDFIKQLELTPGLTNIYSIY